MKIIFNTDQIYKHGGVEKVMATKANYFANLPDTQVYIITTEQVGKDPRYNLDSRIHMLDLDIDYDRTKSYFSTSNLKKVYRHFRKQSALLRMINPQFVISPNYNFDHYWLPFIHRKSKKIKERHGSGFFAFEARKSASFFKRVKNYLNDWIDSKYDHIVVLNNDEKNYVSSNNAVVIPNPVEIPSEISKLENKKVLAAGRIAPVKGFDELITAWSKVNENSSGWELHIYGDDYLDTQKELEKLIKRLNLEDKVFFKESVPDLQKIMHSYSIYAMSSMSECFPMVLLEALSVGVPVVSYDCPNGPRHIITNDKDGFLTEYKNPQDLAGKLIHLINNDDLIKEFGRSAKINSARFSTLKIMSQWSDLLNLPNV